MLVTTRERMRQLSSSIDAMVNVIKHDLSDEAINKEYGKMRKHTIAEMLNKIHDTCVLIGSGDPYYYADLEIGFDEDSFPVKHLGVDD